MTPGVRGTKAACAKERVVPCKCHAMYFIVHITASVFINDDERGLHADYEDWLEDVRSKLRQAPHEPISKYRHNHTGEACPGRRTGTTKTPI
jgi:thiamine phosphate synthase YjbQ (UPF0047 family)